jgi:hypothetical protein
VEFGAIPPHDSDPSNKKVPQGTNKIDKDLHDLDGLVPPHGSRDARKIVHLLEHPTDVHLGEARAILYDTESRRVLTFIGDRLAKVLSPPHIGFAVDLINRKSLLSTDAFLRGLVSRELKAVRHGLSSPLAGPDMAPLRVAIAKLCVDPDLFFSEKTRERHQGEIDKLLFFPIVLLRRAASNEVTSVLVKAATIGGIEPERNRRALEALTHLEESHPHHRMVSQEGVAALVDTMGSFLRDPFNRLDAYAFVERWLRKEPSRPPEATRLVRDALHRLWREYREGGIGGVESCAANIMDVVALSRHFDDPLSREVRLQACDDPHTGVASLARLVVFGPTEPLLDNLRDATGDDAPLEERLRAIRVLGYSVSPQHDKQLHSIYSDVIARGFRGDEDDPEVVGPIRTALLSVMARRLFTLPLSDPFSQAVLSDAMSQKVGEASLLASTLLAITRQGRVMPLSFYDEPTLLRPIGLCIELLRHQAKIDDPSITPIADAIEGHFILDGPARFGFQLTRTRD